MAVRDLIVTLIGRDNTDRAFGSAGKNADGLGGRLKKFGAVAAVGFGALAAGAVVGGKALFSTAAELEQMGTKADTVFGSQVGQVQKWADANARGMGLTSQRAVGLAANFADLLIPMGFTRDQAAGMSTDVLGLSGALSQWSGGQKSAAEVSAILAKAMLGERDELKSLGISISEADVKAQLLADGTSKLTGAALQQATATATQTLIMAKSTDAQAAFAAGGSPLLSAQAKVTASLNTVRDTLATKLIPVFARVATWAADNLPAAFARIEAAMRPVMAFFMGTVVPFMERGMAAVSTAFGKGSSDTSGSMAAVRTAIAQVVAFAGPAFASLRSIVSSVTTIVMLLWSTFGATLVRLTTTNFAAILTTVRGVLRVIEGVLDVFVGLFTGDWSRMWGGVKAVTSGALAVLTGLLSIAWSVIRAAVSVLFIALRAGFDQGWDVLTSRFDAGVDAAVSLARGLPGRAAGALSGLDNVLSSAASGAWAQFRSAAGAGIGRAVDAVDSVPGRLVGALGNLGGLLVGAGRELMSGLARGIGERISAVTDMVRRAAQRIKDLLPGSPVKDGPLTSWNNGGAGKRLMGMLADGITAGTPGVRGALTSALDVVDLAGVSLGGAGYANRRMAATAAPPQAGPSRTYQVNITGTLDPSLSEESIVNALRRMELLAGG